MKRIVILMTLLVIMLTKPVKADELIIQKSIATAYCLTGTTATGTHTTQGRTVASKPEWFGAVMYVWIDDGDGIIKPDNFLGVFTVEDTGGETIKSGTVIDIYIADYEEAKNFGAKDVIIQVVKSEG